MSEEELDYLLGSSLVSQDGKERFKGITHLEQLLKAEDLTRLENGILNSLVAVLAPLLGDNNFKICQGVLGCIDTLLDKTGTQLVPFLPILLDGVGEKLGDPKSTVRDKALDVIQRSMTVLNPIEVLERLDPLFQHRNWRVKEQMLFCFNQTLQNFGCSGLSLMAFVNKFVKLLEDPNNSVREAAIQSLGEIYSFVGDDLKDVLKEKNIRAAQLNVIFEKFASIEPNHERVPLFETTASTRSATVTKKSPKLTHKAPSAPSFLDRLQDNTKLKPLKVYSDKDLVKEFEKMSVVLADADADWKLRTEALGKLQRLVYGGATQYPSFVTCLYSLREPLEIQLSDLRSSVVKEACATVNTLAAALSNSFEPFMEFFITALLKSVITTITIIAESCHNCIKTLLQACHTERVIPLILKSGNNHKVLRARCIEYVLLLLAEYSTNHLDKHLDMFEDIIRSRLSDAQPEVRSTAKQCYWTFISNYPDRATRLFNSLDSSVQKHLNDDKHETKKIKHVLTLSNGAAKRGSVEEISLNSSGSFTLGKAMKVPQSQPQSQSQSYAQQHANSLASTSLTQVTLKQAARTVVSTAPVAPMVTQSRPMRVVEEKEPVLDPTSPAPGLTMGGPAKRIANPSTTPMQALPATKRLESGPQRVAMPPLKEAKEELKSSGGSSGSSARRVIVPPQPAPTIVTAPPPAPAPVAKPQHHPQPAKVSAPAHSAPTPAPIPEISHSRAVQYTLEKGTSTLWSNRVECFEELQALFTSGKSPDVLSHFDKITGMCIDHLNDPHHKVVQQCLTALHPMVSVYYQELEEQLERLLQNLLKKFSDPKESIRKGSLSLMNKIVDTYQPDLISHFLLKVLEQSNPKLKVTCLEHLTNLIARSTQFYRNMRVCVQKIVALASEKNGTLRKGATAFLFHLYSNYKQELLSQLPLLPVTVQLEVRRILIPFAPNLDEELLHSARSEPSQKRAPANHALQREDSCVLDESAHFEPLSNVDAEFEEYSNQFEQQDDERSSFEQVEETLQQEAEQTQDLIANRRVSFLSPNKKLAGKDAELMSVLTKVSSDTMSTRKEGVYNLIEFSRGNDTTFWKTNFPKIITAAIYLTKDEDPFIRELSMLLLNEMLKNQNSEHFTEFMDALVIALLESSKDNAREVCQVADETLEQMTVTIATEKIIQAFVPVLTLRDPRYGVHLLTCIKTLTKAVERADPRTLARQIGNLLPGLFEAFKSTSADIRKAVVLCLVDIYSVLGEDFAPYLAQLTPTQAKLVQIYYHKRKTTQQATLVQ